MWSRATVSNVVLHTGHFARLVQVSSWQTPWQHGSNRLHIGFSWQAQQLWILRTLAVVVPYWLMMMSSSSAAFSHVSSRAPASISTTLRDSVLTNSTLRVWVVAGSWRLTNIALHRCSFDLSRSCSALSFSRTVVGVTVDDTCNKVNKMSAAV